VKILLDECLPVAFRLSFPTHDAHPAEWAGLKGKSNGELMESAEVAGYDVLLTVDQGLPYQRPSVGHKISVILIRSRTNQLEDLLPLVSAIEVALEHLLPGETVTIPL
jgi:predicted nuclease of predicted toxin-antitoxin system